MSIQWLPKVDHTYCTGCGSCVSACPEQALSMIKPKIILINLAACTYCRTCEDICPNEAIELPYLICFAA
ncbi:MAG: 4Fe-4S binding protein [Anaerolineales bacterium]|nr:4Fe-4S binding protein [Anaerolineales bacterium]